MNPIYQVQCKSYTHKNKVYVDASDSNCTEFKDVAINDAMGLIHSFRRERAGDEVLSIIETNLETGEVKTVLNKVQLQDIYNNREERERISDVVLDRDIQQRQFLEAAE